MTYQGNIVHKACFPQNKLVIKKKTYKLEAIDGIYYPKGSLLKGNIIGNPLKRTDVGPLSINRKEELGIKAPI